MKLLLLFFILVFCGAFAQNFPMNQKEPMLIVQNTILAKVNKETISVIDVMKRMDLQFHRSYPQLIGNKVAQHQFYAAHWRHFLSDMIDTQLILADAKAKEVKLTDGEVREEIEKRFGPNVMLSLDRLNLTFEEAWKMVKNEMIVQRMNWIFIHSKALQSVTPEKLRLAYNQHCLENPAKETWKYQVVSIHPEKKENLDDLISEIHSALKSQSSGDLETICQSLGTEKSGSCKISLSKEMEVLDQQLSEKYKSVLTTLKPGEFSSAILQKSKHATFPFYRIFHLIDHESLPPPKFESLEKKLEDEMINERVQEYSLIYLQKIRKRYGYEHLSSDMVDENFEPFMIE